MLYTLKGAGVCPMSTQRHFDDKKSSIFGCMVEIWLKLNLDCILSSKSRRKWLVVLQLTFECILPIEYGGWLIKIKLSSLCEVHSQSNYFEAPQAFYAYHYKCCGQKSYRESRNDYGGILGHWKTVR